MKKLICVVAALLILVPATLGAPNNAKAKKNPLLKRTDKEWLTSDEARRIAGQVMAFQRATGGWPKNIDMCSPLTASELEAVRESSGRLDDSTTDNGATILQLRFLARMYKVTGDTLCHDSFRRGVEFLLSGQYPNGGWPQFWPNPKGYQVHITYNDGAMTNTLNLFFDMLSRKGAFSGDLFDDALARRVRAAFDKGIECVLATQIVVDGKPTVWCQQHDRETLAPAPARKFELASFCSQESAEIVELLMKLPEPDERVRAAVDGAMRWFDEHKLTGYRVERVGERFSPEEDTRLVADPDAGPLWGRFYDLENCEIFVCDRDGIPRRSLQEIGPERRNGYSWYNDHPAQLYPLYARWKQKHGF